MLMKQTHICVIKLLSYSYREITLLVSYLTMRFILEMKILAMHAYYKVRKMEQQWIYRFGK
jgi:hypothetical protein